MDGVMEMVIAHRLRVRSCIFVVAVTVAMLVGAVPASAATLPAGFAETTLTSSLARPTAFALAPDGRIFVSEKSGKLRVIEDDVLLSMPFVDLTSNVNDAGERGLLGIAFDPLFANNHWVYVYYTAQTPTIHNRVSRFVANGNVAVPGSEDVVFELPTLSATNHNGGAIHFGPDGKLYIAVGDNAKGAPAQALNNLFGKVLRIYKGGGIPTDNPFFNQTTGRNRAIWALGLRNPFTFAFRPGTTTMYINDVGQQTWEEINQGVAGGNYGWPATEGPTSNPEFISPLWFYGHGSSASTGCAITGGAFSSPATTQFPARFRNDYFYADFCSGWIHRYEPGLDRSLIFARNITQPVDLLVSPDGALYYLARGSSAATGRVVRVTYVG
jgi:glucose/arabinose dehydrogenase